MSGLRRICLVGVRGVGKTTLIRSIIKELPQIDYIVGSAVLRELAGAEFDHFDRLPLATKERYRKDAIRWMEARQAEQGKHLLCDGHTTLFNEGMGSSEIVFTQQDCQFFRELILLESPVDLILQQRRGDSSKARSLDPSVISKELAAESDACQRIAALWGMSLHRLPPSRDPQTAYFLKELLS